MAEDLKCRSRPDLCTFHQGSTSTRFRSLTFQLFCLHTVLEHEIQRFPAVSLSMTVAPLKSLATVVPRSKLVMHPKATMPSWLVHVMFCFHPRASRYCVAMSAGLTSVGTLRTLGRCAAISSWTHNHPHCIPMSSSLQPAAPNELLLWSERGTVLHQWTMLATIETMMWSPARIGQRTQQCLFVDLCCDSHAAKQNQTSKL